MKTILCSLALGALAHLAAAQQSPLRNHAVVANGFVLLQHDDDGSLVGRGDAYRAHFAAEGMRFEPALPTAPQLQHLALTATRAGRGELAPLPQATAPAVDGQRVHYHRGTVDEVYDVRATGVEQSFVFDSLPAGEGDLVVELQVDATLPVHETGHDHVVFAGEHGGVRIGGVVGIDAHGDRIAGTMSCGDGRIELRLPAAFVNRAALPLVLDPIVNTFSITATNATSALEDAELSYDATTGKYAIAFCIDLASNARELRFVLSNGSPLGNTPVFGVATTAATGGPIALANCNLRNCFVVAWTETMPFAGTPPTFAMVRGRLLQPTGALGPVTALAGIPSLPRSQVQFLSGAQTNSAVLKFVCIRGGTAFPVGELWSLTVDVSGALIAANPRDVSATTRACTAIAISQVEDLDRDFLVVWSESNATLGQHLIAGATYDVAGIAQSNQWRYVASGPAVQMRVDGDGLLQAWAVGVGFDGGASSYAAPTFFSVWIDPSHAGMLLDGGLTTLPHNNGSRSFPIASTPRMIHTVHWEFLAGRCTSTLPNCETTTFGVHNHQGCTLCNSESRIHTLLWAALLRPRAYGDTTYGPDAVKVAYIGTGLGMSRVRVPVPGC